MRSANERFRHQLRSSSNPRKKNLKKFISKIKMIITSPTKPHSCTNFNKNSTCWSLSSSCRLKTKDWLTLNGKSVKKKILFYQSKDKKTFFFYQFEKLWTQNLWSRKSDPQLIHLKVHDWLKLCKCFSFRPKNQKFHLTKLIFQTKERNQDKEGEGSRKTTKWKA